MLDLILFGMWRRGDRKRMARANAKAHFAELDRRETRAQKAAHKAEMKRIKAEADAAYYEDRKRRRFKNGLLDRISYTFGN